MKPAATGQCSGTRVVRSPFSHRAPCDHIGRYEHEGKWYCRRHHPPTVDAKRQARDQKWDREWTAQQKARERRDKHRDAAEKICAILSGDTGSKIPRIKPLLKTWSETL